MKSNDEIKAYIHDTQTKELLELESCLGGWIIPKHVLVENGYHGNISLATKLCKRAQNKMKNKHHVFTVTFDKYLGVVVCLLFNDAGSLERYRNDIGDIFLHLDKMSI